MLYRKLLMVGSSSQAISSHWVLPGGHIITEGENGSLFFADPAVGWPIPTGTGDPFIDSQRRVGTYELLNFGGGAGEARSIRMRESGTDREEVRSLGPYRGYASENIAISMTTPGTESNPYGYSRPSWLLSSASGGSRETGYTADWPWEQQSNGTQGPQGGQSTSPPHVQIIQAHYTPRMAYPWGVCATRDLGVVTRLEATAITGAPDGTDPSGRPWLGWTIDASGVVRRIADLTPGQARQLGRENSFVPPDDEIISSSGQNYAWQFIRPIGPAGPNAILCSACLRYEETYTRIPTAEERPYYMRGREGFGTNHASEILQNVAWYYGNTQPVRITERRASFLFCVVVIQAGGISSVSVTGKSSSRSTSLALLDPSYSVTFKLYRRRDGGYDVIWRNHPDYDNFAYRGETFATEYVTSPNGWTTPIIWPTYKGQILSNYYPVWFTPESPTLGSRPPTKPSTWDEKTQGPWVTPPYDVDENFAWRGMRYWWPNEQEWHWQKSQNDTGSDYGRYGRAVTVHPLAPNGPYARNGARQWYGDGEFAVARHQDGTFSSHEAGRIVPGIETGPGGSLQPYAESDGLNPIMRDLRWPGRAYRMVMTQDGQWQFSNGRGWSPMQSFGAVEGTICVGAKLEPPEDADPV